MSQPYVGEIRAFGFPRIPTGWFPCDGRLLSIADYQTLYTLLGTTFGGDGITTFGVPDLRGRRPVHWGTMLGGSTYTLGQKAGTEEVTLLLAQIPQHNHYMAAFAATATAITPGPTVGVGTIGNDTLYLPETTGATAVVMDTEAVGFTGGSQPHENCAPTLTVSICISAFGVFPSQN
ncbi:MAG: tail fiber protein [Caulobacter sp.]